MDFFFLFLFSFFLCPFHFISFFFSGFTTFATILSMIYACMNFSAANIIDNDVI